MDTLSNYRKRALASLEHGWGTFVCATLVYLVISSICQSFTRRIGFIGWSQSGDDHFVAASYVGILYDVPRPYPWRESRIGEPFPRLFEGMVLKEPAHPSVAVCLHPSLDTSAHHSRHHQGSFLCHDALCAERQSQYEE